MEDIKSYGYRAGVEPLKATENKRKVSKNGGRRMKKHLLDLQLFADDGADGSSQEPANPATETEEAEGKENEPKPEKKYSDDDVDKILNKKFAEWEKKKQKEVDEAKKLADMNAKEKAEYERDKLQKELDALREKDSLSEMTKTARKMLSDEGVSVSDDLLSMVVSTDAEKTKAAVDAFAKAFNGAVEAAVKEKLRGNPPKKGTGGGAPMTKEQILAIKDNEARQKAMLENRELFNF